MSDFDRNTWCFLGMPVDAIAYRQAVERISASAAGDRRCFFSTPNLNFIVTAIGDRKFQESVIRSDLVLLDGMPSVWMAKMIGIPGIEKISGSNLFETLWHEEPVDSRKIKVFLFGGECGVATSACERINRQARGLQCVGCHYPGFEPLEAMSSDATVELINRANADFIVVALGAKKGQAWIMANLDRLRAPVVSHLGAVVNFSAGTVSRAPVWMQKYGLEWLWRIYQEPSLWTRYLYDGFYVAGLILFRLLPYMLWRRWHFRQLENSDPLSCSILDEEATTTILLRGNCLHGTIGELRRLFEREARKCRAINLDFNQVELIDGAFIGLCQMLYKQALSDRFSLSFSNLSPLHRRIFTWNCADYLL